MTTSGHYKILIAWTRMRTWIFLKLYVVLLAPTHCSKTLLFPTVCANYSEMCFFFSITRTHARTPRFLSCAAASRPFSLLETAEGRQVLGLLAGHAPVVGLVDGLVVLPGRLVVDGQPLDGLGGQRLNRKTVTSQKGNGVAIICTSSFFLTHPNVDDGVGAVALQGVEGQLPLEVAGVQPGNGKAVAVAGLHTNTTIRTSCKAPWEMFQNAQRGRLRTLLRKQVRRSRKRSYCWGLVAALVLAALSSKVVSTTKNKLHK